MSDVHIDDGQSSSWRSLQKGPDMLQIGLRGASARYTADPLRVR